MSAQWRVACLALGRSLRRKLGSVDVMRQPWGCTRAVGNWADHVHLLALFCTLCQRSSYHYIITISVPVIAASPTTPCHKRFHPSVCKG